jgi:predicted RNA-binding protein with PUA-like domain
MSGVQYIKCPMAKLTAPKNKTKASKSTKSAPAPFVSTGYWLMKSEPSSYSIDDFARDKKTLWTGVRNYQARNFMMNSMKPGDRLLFYHSNAEPSACVGVGSIVRPNQPDPSALDPKSDYHDPKASHDHPIWFCAEVKFDERFAKPVTLDEIRSTPALAEMALLQKGQRLSVQPVSKKEFDLILKKGRGS